MAGGLLAAWEESNPEPERPSVESVMTDLETGRCSPRKGKLAEMLDGHFNRMSFDLAAALNTDSQRAWVKARAEWERSRARFDQSIDRAKLLYLDRVLFDHESAFLMLEDFKHFEADLGPIGPIGPMGGAA